MWTHEHAERDTGSPDKSQFRHSLLYGLRALGLEDAPNIHGTFNFFLLCGGERSLDGDDEIKNYFPLGMVPTLKHQ